jgi:TrmH family RNA methyltransferase
MPAASFHARIRIVQSRQNARVKDLRAGLHGNGRTPSGGIAIEGAHLVIEALRSGLRLHTIFIRSGSETLLETVGQAANLDSATLDGVTDILELPDDVFLSAVATEHPQGIAALAAAPQFTVDDLFLAPRPLLLVLAGLQDPGNLGTLVRSAEAFGAAGILALAGTVSCWNPKALRASSGSAFRMPILSLPEEAAVAALRAHRVVIYAAVASGGTIASEAALHYASALVIGNEGAGLPPSLLAAASHRITLPCPGPVESLNAAVAGSLLLYEASRQRDEEASRQRDDQAARQSNEETSSHRLPQAPSSDSPPSGGHP